MKKCSKCKVFQELDQFHRHSGKPDGLQLHCKQCFRKTGKSYRQRHIEEIKEAKQKYYLDHKDSHNQYCKDHYHLNKDQAHERYLDYYTKNIPAYRARGAKRRASQKQAIAAWLDPIKVEWFYAEAQRLTQETGVMHVVDHIDPLQHKLICGLHCEANLQVLTESENAKKHNKFTPYTIF